MEKSESAKRLLLIAEDAEDNYILYKVCLSKEYRIIHAWNGEEAVDLFKKESPDIVLMDIKMPIVDGIQAIFQIKALNEKVPVIAVTAYATEYDKDQISQAGFDDYLTKPIEMSDLKEKIAKLVKEKE